MSLTRYVAQFVVGAGRRDTQAGPPMEACRLATRSILDGLGLALAGNAAESGQIVRGYLGALGCAGTSTVIGSDVRTIPRFAAFANGAAMHADDYDDTQLATAKDRVYGLLTHPTAPVLPAVLAVAESDHRSGADVLDAYMVGSEVEMKVAEAIAPRHYQDGFHTTGTVGAIGAAAGLARLLRMDLDHTMQAIGLAASEASGLRENFGTMTKPFHAGRAAENGVVAADFVCRGWTAASNILEAKRGFFSAAGGGYDASLIEGKLGAPWHFISPGVSIKPHPSGSLTHPGMAVMAGLITQHDIRPENVKHVRVGTNKNMPNALIHHRPETELNAKFSMEFCMAILLLERKGGLAQFTAEVVRRPDVRSMIEKIDFVVDPEAEASGYDKMTTIIEIELTDGKVVRGRADFGKGSPVDPMTDAELEAKFRDCAEWGHLPKDRAAKVAELVWRLPEVTDIGEVTALLRV